MNKLEYRSDGLEKGKKRWHGKGEEEMAKGEGEMAKGEEEMAEGEEEITGERRGNRMESGLDRR